MALFWDITLDYKELRDGNYLELGWRCTKLGAHIRNTTPLPP